MTVALRAGFEPEVWQDNQRAPREAEELDAIGHSAGEIARGLFAALDWLPAAVLLVERLGHIVLANGRAQRYLDRRAGIRESDGRLRCEFSQSSARLDTALVELSGKNVRSTIAVTARRGDGGRPLELMLSPVPGGKAVLVFAFDPDEGAGCSQALARQLYGLSEREAEVAHAVVTGRTLHEIARSLGVDKETVRSHLKRVFEKTHTSRQAELARLLSIGLFGLGTAP
jgi:DNA-binding CsgD family transcriptional regulator